MASVDQAIATWIGHVQARIFSPAARKRCGRSMTNWPRWFAASASEIDAELECWLKTAYDQAG